jgi:segregation and condensation protein B
MTEINPKKIAELEALLFYYGEPVTLKKIAKMMELSKNECEAAINALEENLTNEARGFTILRNGEEIQLVTKPIFKDLMEKIVFEEFREELTPAALETLAIVAYLGPIKKPLIDYIRGVNSSFTLRSLLMRGLIEKEAELERSNVFLYRITFDFLKHLGINKVEELPDYARFQGILKKIETGQNL